MTDPSTPQPGRRMTAAAKVKLNELIGGGCSVSEAMRIVSSDPSAFEEVTAPPPPAAPAPRPAWSGDSTDWSGVLEKLARMRALDRGRALFGASRHRYELAPPASEREVAALEKKWKVELPPGLRAFYTQVGNGGAGPGYGLFPVSELMRFKATTPYPGVEALRARAPKTATVPANRYLAPMRSSQRSGLMGVANLGCGIYTSVVSTGDVGRVVTVDEEGVNETDETLVQHVTNWLDDAIRRFELVQEQRGRGASREEMVQAMKRAFPQQADRASFDVDAALRGLEPLTG